MKQGELQQILFQWMPRQVAPHTRYTFTLRELWDTGRSPEEGFLTSRTLYEQQDIYGNSLFYGMDKPALLPGKRYAWQVRAISANPALAGMSNPTDDNGVYQNNGLSEIYYFDYVENCTAPLMLTAKNAGKGKAEVRWMMPGGPAGGQYRIQYRRADTGGNWMTADSYTESHQLTRLKDQTEYEYRVGAVCGSTPVYSTYDTPENAYTYSTIQRFTTDAKENAVNPAYQCGTESQVSISNREPLQGSLGLNDVFTAGDFPVTVIEADGGNGTYSGKGSIVVPYLSDTKLAVIFKNIQLNTDRQLISGVVETTYDVNETAMQFVDEGIGKTFGDTGVKNVQINYTITEITYSATPPPGRITIKGDAGSDGTTTGGEGSSEELPAGRDYQFTDKNGFVWNVDEKGTVTKSGKQAEGGKSTANNTEGVTGGTGQTGTGSITAYAVKDITVTWDAQGSTYAYDDPVTLPEQIRKTYPSVKDAEGKTVYPPFKAVVNKKEDFITAKLSYQNGKPTGGKIVFKTLDGREIEAKETGADTYRLALKGLFDYATEDITAMLVPNDSTQKQKVIGSFKLVHLGEKTIDVSLVPLDDASVKQLDDIEKELTNTYGKVGVTFNVKKESVLDISNIVSGD
ncbi:MAG: fibronectin type III domain-containing protein, partial [Bacteroidia bacterium]|nr:fibronectin type III domain-containing protein [Bacteroidia bacterium]